MQTVLETCENQPVCEVWTRSVHHLESRSLVKRRFGDDVRLPAAVLPESLWLRTSAFLLATTPLAVA